MSNSRQRLIAAGCLAIGVCAGVAGAEVLDAVQRGYASSGMFSLRTNQTASARVVLDDFAEAPPARILMQMLDAAGVVVAKKEATLLPGQAATLQKAGPGVFRLLTTIVDPNLQLSARRTTVSTIEVADALTGVVRPVCSDFGGQGHDRY